MDPFPEEIRRFLDTNIDSVEQLEILRVVQSVPDKEWNAPGLVREIQASAPVILAHMQALHHRGLLTMVSRGAETLCRHGARTPELAAALGQLLKLYAQRPVTMINLVHAHSRAASPQLHSR